MKRSPAAPVPPLRRAGAAALLPARAIVLADASPAFKPMVLPRGAEFTRRLLDRMGPSSWFDFAVKHGWSRAILFGMERTLLPGLFLHSLLRKRLLDEIAEGVDCPQLVVLGGETDTLAWRRQAARPASFCAELVHPALEPLKRRAFDDASAAGPVLLPADLLDTLPGELLRREPRFDPRRPTLFVAEGLLMHLPPVRVSELFRDLAALAAPGSRFAFSFMEALPEQPLGFRQGEHAIDWWMRWFRRPFLWGLARERVAAFAQEHGWRIDRLSSPAELRARFLRPAGLLDAPLLEGESVALLSIP